MNRQDTVKKQNMNNEVFLCIIKRGQTLRVPVNDILYIDSRDRKLFVYTTDSVYEYNDKMDNVFELLEPEGFIRCHQSFLVRLSAVSVVRRDKLVVGEKEIPISRKYKEEVRDILTKNATSESGERAYLSECDDIHFGKLLCIDGPYSGKLFKLVPEQEITIGRDGLVCDIVINLPRISRQHLRVVFHKNKASYEITDISANGTYIDGEIRLEKGVRYEIEAGETVLLGDGTTTFKLG